MEFSKEKLFQLVRILGASAIVLSGSVFLLQGVQNIGSFARFLSFAGLASGLIVAGLICAKSLKEPRGARLFLSLATSGGVVLFAQVAAMLYSRNQVGVSLFPEFLSYQVSSMSQLALGITLTTVFSIAASVLTFKFLDRKNAAIHLTAYLTLCVIILMPGRGILLPVLGILGFVAYLFYLFRGEFVKWHSMSGPQLQVMMLTALPVLLLTTRNAFYDHHLLLFGLSQLFVSTLFFLWNAKSPKILLRFSTTLFAVVGINSVIIALLEAGSIPMQWGVFALALANHYLLKILNFTKVIRTEMPMLIGWFSLVPALSTFLLYDYHFKYVLPTFLLSAFLIYEAYSIKSISLLRAGFILGVISSGAAIVQAFATVNVFHWLNLAIFGVVIIIGSSFLERHRNDVAKKWSLLMSHFRVPQIIENEVTEMKVTDSI